MFDALHIQMNEEAQHPVNFCSSLRASPEEEQRIAEMKESVTCNLRFAIEQVNQESESEYAKIDFSRLSDPPEPVQELEQQDHVYLGHPNDPSHWIERPKPKIAYYLQYTPTNPQQPMQQPYYNARQQYYMTPEQQMAINNTAFYMRNRGPWSMNYVVNKAGPMTHPSQQRTRKWVDEYAQKMEKDLNDPVKLSQPLVEKKKNTAEALIGDGFVPAREGMFKSDADLEDNNYYRLKGNMEKLSEISNTSNQKIDVLSKAFKGKHAVKQKKSPEEIAAMQSIRRSTTTPSINPKYLDYNFVGKSGEGYWSLGKAQQQAKQDTLMTPQERAYANAAALKGYNKACQIGSNLETNPLDDTEESEEYQQAGYEQYMQHQYGYMPQYSGAYFGGYGYTDQYGLPTRWFNDGGKCYLPTAKDYRDGNVYQFELVNEEDKKEDIAIDPVVDDSDSFGAQLISSYVDKDGIRHIENIYDLDEKRNLTDEELVEEIKKNNSRKDFEDALYAKNHKIKTEKEQFLSDDSYFVAKEISRYNEHLGSILLWYKANAIDRDYRLLLKKCRDQLILYRNEDPFALVKSGIICAADKLINVGPKPTTEEEMERLTKAEEERAEQFEQKLVESGIHRTRAHTIAYKELKALSKCRTLDEKVETLRSMRDLQMILREKDFAMQLVEEIYKNFSEMRRQQIFNYELYKKMRIHSYPKSKLADSNENFDQIYDEWWNLPSVDKTEQEDYADKYADRMMSLNQARLDYYANCSIPDSYWNNLCMQRYTQYINETCRDEQGNPLPLFERMSNMIYREKEDQLQQQIQKGEGIYAILKPKGIAGNYHNYAMNMLHSPTYYNQGVPTFMQNANPTYLPIYNRQGEYDNKQQTFIRAMFHKHKMGGVL